MLSCKSVRTWVAHCQYLDKKEFLFGTAFVDRNEDAETARLELERLISDCFPTMPNIIAVEPGMIILVDPLW